MTASTFRRFSAVTGLALAGLAALAVPAAAANPAIAAAQEQHAATLSLEVIAEGRILQLDRAGTLRDKRQRPLSVSRLDLLLTGFSLQRPDGSWTTPGIWHGFFRAGEPGRRQTLNGVAPGRYVAARFEVGVEPKANHGNPNRLAPDDPLHPLVNGMHWGWTGGYVFFALEGHWPIEPASANDTAGYSYHLGGNANRVPVMLRSPLYVRPGQGLRLQLDATPLLRGLDLVRDGESTHSRTEDAAVRALKGTLPRVFSIAVTDAQETKRGGVPGVTPSSQAALEPYPFVTPPQFPTVRLPADNPLTQVGVALGRALFNDKRLSRDNTVSCASCHQAKGAFADPGKATSVGIDGRRGQRNAMPLFNLAWVPLFFWDGRVKTLREQVLHPIVHPDEMGAELSAVVQRLTADSQLAAQFRTAFGQPPSVDTISLALEQFALSLVSHDSKFDRVQRGAERFSPKEKRGFELFLTEHDPALGLRGADCFHCHGGPLFTNHKLMNNGLSTRGSDTGREVVTRDPADRAKFRTPSLRNIAVTGPYMHDGRLRTLEDVIEHYDHGVERNSTLDPNLAKHPRVGMQLSREDKAALVAFLKTLTDSDFTLTRR